MIYPRCYLIGGALDANGRRCQANGRSLLDKQQKFLILGRLCQPFGRGTSADPGDRRRQTLAFRTFDELVFDDDFATARIAGGPVIEFTPLESRLLEFLVQRPGRITSRDQILDAITEPGSDRNERSVDYLVNRVRGKLADDRQNPRFIGTRYGEGYLWLAEPTAPASPAIGADIVVGPFIGAALLQGDGHEALRFGRTVADIVTVECDAERTVAFDPDCPPAEAMPSQAPRLSVELSFFTRGRSVDCVISTRRFITGETLAATRVRLRDANGASIWSAAGLRAEMAVLMGNTWRSRASGMEATVSLNVAMHEASDFADQPMKSWSANDAHLKALRAADPHDPKLKLMYATHLHNRYVLLGHQLWSNGDPGTAAVESEIERLVLDALPVLRHDPGACVMMGKLLYFVDRDYTSLAVELIEDSLTRTTALSSSLAIAGQMRAFMGDTAGALDGIEQAIALAKPKSSSHLYALVLRLQVVAAAGDWDRLAEARAALAAVSRPAMLFLEPFSTDPRAPSLKARAIVRLFSRAYATGLLRHREYMAGRLYVRPEHRRNFMRPAMRVLTDRFGERVVPPELRDLLLPAEQET